MFKLHRNSKAAKSGENVDFRFSQLKALQVPKGWDKLYVSIISVQTGKTISKSNKVLVRNGTCLWTENITESIWVSQDDSSKEFEDCLYKLVVAMGSARSGILGEATINITGYVKSGTSVFVSVPLKKCNYGTTLQLKIQCLTPRTDLRDDKSKETDAEDPNDNSLDLGGQSDGSGNDLPRGPESYSSKEHDPRPHQEDLRSQVSKGVLKGISFSSSGSPHSSGENTSQGGTPNGEDRYDPTNSKSFSSEIMDSENYSNTRSLRNISSSKDLLEAAEDTIEELRKEAKMWERNAQKLMLDLEIMREEFADQSKKQTSLEIEFSAMKSERDGLINEVERLNLLLEKSEDEEHRKEDPVPIQKELEEEMRFQKESNGNLAMQLSRSQESNIELVSVLQELEEIVEKQKLEIENLTKEQPRFESELSAKEEEIVHLRAKLSKTIEQGRSVEAAVVKEMEVLKKELQELERDCNELTEENLDLLFKLKEVNSGSNRGGSITYELASIDYSAKSVSSSSDHEGGEYCHEDKPTKKKMIKEEFEALKMELENKNRDLVEKGKLEEAEIEHLKRENLLMRENLEAMQRESEVTLKCLSDLQNDLSVLNASFDAHGSANKILERKSLELEMENARLESEVDSNRAELQRKEEKIEEYEARMLETWDARKALRTENGDLRKKAKELGDLFEKCSVKVESLEQNLALLMEDVALKDKELSSEIQKLLDENRAHEERISEFRIEAENKVRELMSTKEKLKTSLNEIELRLTVSEYERRKLAEESIIMRDQLQKMDKFKSEKEKAEDLLEVISRECGDLKSEMEKVVEELENCKKSKTTLEKDLTAREALCAEAAEVINEISEIQKETRQYQQERDEFATKVRVLEEELKVIKEERKNQKHYSGGVRNVGASKVNNKSEAARSTNKQRDGRRKPPSKDVVRDQQSHSITRQQKEDDRISNVSDDSLLAEINIEIDGTYKPPHNRLLSYEAAPAGELVTRERFEQTKSSLEAELIELRERYSYMSLKYAEGEAEREELVMKLKASRSVKRWFS